MDGGKGWDREMRNGGLKNSVNRGGMRNMVTRDLYNIADKQKDPITAYPLLLCRSYHHHHHGGPSVSRMTFQSCSGQAPLQSVLFFFLALQCCLYPKVRTFQAPTRSFFC